MVRPAYSASANIGQATALPGMSLSVMIQMKPATSAAAAGDGRPWK